MSPGFGIMETRWNEGLAWERPGLWGFFLVADFWQMRGKTSSLHCNTHGQILLEPHCGSAKERIISQTSQKFPPGSPLQPLQIWITMRMGRNELPSLSWSPGIIVFPDCVVLPALKPIFPQQNHPPLHPWHLYFSEMCHRGRSGLAQVSSQLYHS